MSENDDEKYGIVGSTLKNEAENLVDNTIKSVSGAVETTKNLAGFLERDIKNGIDWITASPEERAEEERKEQEKKKEAKAKEEADKAKKKEDEKAEAERMKELKKTYIVHTAAIKCSYAVRVSFVVLPESHGEYIHGMEQINVEDTVPEINIRSFGVCTSPENPSVKAAAKKVLKDAKNERKKGFVERVMDKFVGESDEEKEVHENLVKNCAGECNPLIDTDWIDGKEDVLVDGKKAVLGRCKLKCGYDGIIEFYTSGQKE